ncbi:MAG: hypothetical protein OXF11_13545 [Deltaproteobacteria bacterium]|nr:hypothetical protein [Deltaproteobacteria bacterium]
MALDYLPILAQNAAPRPPRKLYRAPRIGWQPLARPLNEMRVSLVTSAAIRQTNQRAFTAGGDPSHRRIAADPDVAVTVDHHSPVGADVRRDAEVVFPRRTLQELARTGVIGSVARTHFSIYGGISDHAAITEELAPELARRLTAMRVDLALMVPY